MAQRGQARALEKASSSEHVAQSSGDPAREVHSAWHDAQRGGNSRSVAATSAERHHWRRVGTRSGEFDLGGALMLLAPAALS